MLDYNMIHNLVLARGCCSHSVAVWRWLETGSSDFHLMTFGVYKFYRVHLVDDFTFTKLIEVRLVI